MPDSIQTKVCRKCAVEKPLDQFNRNKAGTESRDTMCRPCKANYLAEYRAANAEVLNARRREKRATNGDKFRERERQWAASNREARRAYNRQYRQANRDALNAANKKWRTENRERGAELSRKWRLANPEKAAAAVRAWNAKNPDRRLLAQLRRRARIAGTAIGAVDTDALWVTQDGCCGICDEPIDPSLRFPDPMSKSIDHIVALANGGPHQQDNLQWAHLVCNIRKGAKTA